MKNKFLNICIGLGILFLTGGFFVRSIPSVHAAPPSPKEFVEEGASTIGKYSITMGEVTNEGVAFKYAIIINSQTGKTTGYYCGEDAIWKVDPSSLPLPQ